MEGADRRRGGAGRTAGKVCLIGWNPGRRLALFDNAASSIANGPRGSSQRADRHSTVMNLSPHFICRRPKMTQCQEIMKRDIECLTSADAAHHAASRMRDQNIGFLPVCDDEMKVLGTVTDRDIAIRLVAEQRPLDTTVDQIMTREIVACRPDDDISDAQELM